MATTGAATASSPVLFYLGHAVEAYWFVIDEAHRSGDVATREKAGKLLRRHASVAWDELCGGMVRGITAENDHNDKFLKDKVSKSSSNHASKKNKQSHTEISWLFGFCVLCFAPNAHHAVVVVVVVRACLRACVRRATTLPFFLPSVRPAPL